MTQDVRTEALDASPRLFESDLLDKLSRVHHLTPVIVYCPIILGLVI
ncbi:MAG: sterol desaturase family protein, partial [Methylocystis sp.]